MGSAGDADGAEGAGGGHGKAKRRTRQGEEGEEGDVLEGSSLGAADELRFRAKMVGKAAVKSRMQAQGACLHAFLDACL